MLGRNFVAGLVHLVFGFIELLLGLRIILRLFGASEQAQFVDWVYTNSDPLLEPFVGMFPSPEIASQFQLEISALFALAIYALLGYVIEQFILAISQPMTSKKEK